MSEVKKKKTYACQNENCKEVFNNRMARSRHKKKCLFAPPTSKPVAKSKQFIYREESKSYICKKCSVEIKHRNNLSRHPLVCTRIPKTSFACATCNKVFQYQSKLKEHMKVHNIWNMFTCMYCSKNMKSEPNFNRHIISCSSITRCDEVSVSMEYQHANVSAVSENTSLLASNFSEDSYSE